jgi:hypothetical protein
MIKEGSPIKFRDVSRCSSQTSGGIIVIEDSTAKSFPKKEILRESIPRNYDGNPAWVAPQEEA